MIDCDSPQLINKKDSVIPSAISKHSADTSDELNTKSAYEKLEYVISLCSPVIEHTSSMRDRNASSFTKNGDLVGLDKRHSQLIPPPPSRTPTTNRQSFPQYS